MGLKETVRNSYNRWKKDRDLYTAHKRKKLDGIPKGELGSMKRPRRLKGMTIQKPKSTFRSRKRDWLMKQPDDNGNKPRKFNI